MREGITIPYVRVPGLFSDTECRLLKSLRYGVEELALSRQDAAGSVTSRTVAHVSRSGPATDNGPSVCYLVKSRVPENLLTKAELLMSRVAERFDFDVTHMESKIHIVQQQQYQNKRWTNDVGAPHLVRRKISMVITIEESLDCEGGFLDFPEELEGTALPPLGGAILFASFRSHRYNALSQGQRTLMFMWMHGPEFR